MQAEELAEVLRQLSSELVAARLAFTGDPSAFEHEPYLSAAAPLFAALHAVNRMSLNFTKECKARTQDARLEMDGAHLRLQNLKFEQNHLEREIRSCQQFTSSYQILDLLPLNTLQTLADSPNPPITLPLPLPHDQHELMLLRLHFELSERKRLDEEKRSLSVIKARLVRENEAKKVRLGELEKGVEEFVISARTIQARMHAVDAEEQKKAASVALRKGDEIVVDKT